MTEEKRIRPHRHMSTAAVLLIITGIAAAVLSMLAVNYLACLTVAGCNMGFGNVLPAGPGLGLTLGMGAFNGVLYLLGFVLLKLNIRKNGVVMSATFMKLGLLVPMVVSVGLFGEMPSALQLTGFLIAVGAIILINFEKEETTMEFKAGLILLLLAGGGCTLLVALGVLPPIRMVKGIVAKSIFPSSSGYA